MWFVFRAFLVLLFSFSSLLAQAQSGCKYLFPEPGWRGYQQIFNELRQVVALPSDEEEAFGRWFDLNHQSANAYLEEKLNLTSGLKELFDTTPHHRDVLLLNMYLASKRPAHPTEGLRFDETIQPVLAKYIDNGYFQRSSSAGLEYLFLISGRSPSSPDLTASGSEMEIARKIFESYRLPGEEAWHPQTYEFYRDHGPSRQPHPVLQIEENVLRMIARSRAGIRRSTDQLDPAFANYVERVDEFFRSAYQKMFNRRPPVSLRTSLRLTDDIGLSESADQVRRKVYLNSEGALNPQYVLAVGLHEVLHLCFEGFRQESLKEALVEYIREEMHVAMYPSPFRLVSVAESRTEYREALKAIFDLVPHASQAFLEYFASGNAPELRRSLQANLTDKLKQKIRSNPALTPHRTPALLNALESFIKER